MTASPKLPKKRSGWKFFPLKPGSKTPCIPDWENAATDDREQIEAWAIQYPCNWGLACGPSGLAVIDIDGEIGEASLKELQDANFEELPPTLEQKTPRGRHLIFSGNIKTTQNALGPGIDTRGAGGYIVVEPSTLPPGCDGKKDHPGGTYEIVE